MLQEAITLQNEAVEKLIKLTNRKSKKEITFKAPTGSGKTYMMAKYMNEMLEQRNDVIFLVTTLSKGGLGKQNYEKFSEYKKKDFKNLDPYFIATDSSGEEGLFISTGANVYILETAKSSKSGKLMRGPLVNFFKNITEEGLFGGLGKEIYLIKDECHIKTNNIDDLDSYFSKVINFSATPKLSRGQKPDIEITNLAAENAKLIKHVEFDKEADFETAVKKFESIKEDYRNLLNVNPCMIVQISNKDKADQELEDIVFKCLNSAEHSDLKWALIVGDANKCDTNDLMKAKKLPVEQWRRYAKEPLSLLDIIIFKLTVSEGWDIPRACMLYQIRDTQSEQLDEQVLGRVRRNPRLLDYEKLSPQAQDLAMTAWAYGEEPKEETKSIEVLVKKDVQGEVKIKTTKLKTLENNSKFNISAFLSKAPKAVTTKSIFELYAEYKKAPEDVKVMSLNYVDSAEKWYSFASNISEITKKYNDFEYDYESAMEIATDDDGIELLVSFPASSFFLENTIQKEIPEWVWYRKDKNDSFSFDSEAEREWAKHLQSLIVVSNGPKAIKESFGTFMFGKNFPDNSEIRFEYFLNGAKHWSYPDFVMKDTKNRIHIFEVKSVNESNTIQIDKEEYEAKINELKKCYKQASKITDNIFYLPIKDMDDWKIIRYLNGVEEHLTLKQFLDFVRY